ncbi:MAG: molecular chaperone SurA [Gammaproteobacteria bacterium]|nr:MAG: molecular chaperone SurA [Gammaproteobacteria bacterium]
MTRIFSRVLAGLILVLVLAATNLQAAPQLLDRIVAIAGDDVIMLSELRDKARELAAELQRSNPRSMPSDSQIVNKALEELILEKLQLAEAKRLGITADPETVDKAIERIARNNNLTVSQLKEALAAEGMDFQQFRNRIRDQIIISRLINREVTNRIQVSKSEIDQYLAREEAAPDEKREVHLMHILVATPDGASPEQIARARQRAEEARKRLDAGEDFAEIAREFSDARNAIRGGDLGWARIGQLTPAVAEMVSKAREGDILGPFRSGAGFHLLKVAGFRGGKRTARKIVPQIHARHILIRTDEVTSDADARQRLEQLRARALNGEDFANLARSHSQDQGSAIKGGDLGWISPGAMVPEFEEKLNSTPVGAISEPFKTRFGWHIVQVLGKRQHDETEEARRLAAKKAIRDRKAKEATEQYLRRLRDEAYVEVRPDSGL